MDNKVLRTPEEKTAAMIKVLKETGQIKDYLELSERNPEHFEKIVKFICTPKS